DEGAGVAEPPRARLPDALRRLCDLATSFGRSMESKQGLPILPFATPRDWEDWLAAQHSASKGVWLKIAKKGAVIASVSYAEALESALCYGWIDGQNGSLDEQCFLQKFTPRGPRSAWSQINRDKVTELLAQGRLK